jgi:hypothetical protein
MKLLLLVEIIEHSSFKDPKITMLNMRFVIFFKCLMRNTKNPSLHALDFPFARVHWKKAKHGQVVLLPFMVFMLMVCEIGCVHPIGFGLVDGYPKSSFLASNLFDRITFMLASN